MGEESLGASEAGCLGTLGALVDILAKIRLDANIFSTSD